MKKTLAIMMVLVLAMGMVFAAIDPTSADLEMQIKKEDITGRLAAGFTLTAGAETKLNDFVGNANNWMDVSKWESALPSTVGVSIILDKTPDSTAEATKYTLVNPISLFVVARATDATVKFTATTFKGKTTSPAPEDDIEEITYHITVGGFEGDVTSDASVKNVNLNVTNFANINNKAAYYLGGITILTDAVDASKLQDGVTYKATMSATIEAKV